MCATHGPMTDRRGAVAVIFALSAIPLMLFAGLAVDISRAYTIRARLASALDAAGLAVGSSQGTEAELEDRFDKFVAANIPPDIMAMTRDLDVVPGDTLISVTGAADVPTTFLKLVGYDSIPVSASAEITRETTGIEVVMALDNTGSMGGSKLSSLKTAATDLVNILFGPDATSDTVKVGLVPFAGSVNIGPGNEALTTGADAFDWGSTEWAGCVEARPHPYDVQDTFTADAAPGSGGDWTPLYWASHSSYNNWCISWDNPDDCRSIRVGPPSSRGPNKECPRPVTALTNVKATLISEINGMWASGYTHINLGAVWAWRLLSPDAPFTEGTTYDDEEWDKAAVIMTDGQNTTSNSVYTGYGYRWEGRLGSTYSSSARDELDDRLDDVCTAMKNEGIYVYTIVFALDSTSVENMMRDCATDPSMFYVADETDLSSVFQTIGKQLSELRLSR